MIKLYEKPVYYINGRLYENLEEASKKADKNSLDNAKKETIAYGILKSHNTSNSEENMKIKFDALTSHDITFVGIIQTARASGLEKFPIPYVLTNCHNSLCAVGGTINEDDHIFGLSAAKKYGGIFVPPHVAVIHQYMREMMASCGKMILGSDSHTRYGALGTMAIGEGGPELVKQILGKTYDIASPKVVAVHLTGKPRKGVGPQDVALAIIGATFKNGFVKNKVMEFIGDGIKNLSADYRMGIDVMTTETTCLSSIWETDEVIKEYYATFGRMNDYKELKPGNVAKYDSAIEVDLSKIEPMIALPFHPSNVYKISDVVKNPYDVFMMAQKDIDKEIESPNLSFKLVDKIKDGKVFVSQGIIAGCAGGIYENIVEASKILDGSDIGNNEFSLSVYPASLPVYSKLVDNGSISRLVNAGAIIKTAFCGPCFGAGDVPCNNGLSVRHTTRNFPSREGSKPNQNQIATVALMDARSIAATSRNGGVLTSAMDIDYDNKIEKYTFNKSIYEKRVLNDFEKGDTDVALKFGPNIADWPKMVGLKRNILMKAASVIDSPVTTTDELIPSGETSSYRSNPLKLAEFTLSRKDPKYVGRAKKIYEAELKRRDNETDEEFAEMLGKVGAEVADTVFGSFIYANKPGDGSAREQAASCQRVLGGIANIAKEYATKRYRSNLINWGMLPLRIDESIFNVDDFVFIPDIDSAICYGKTVINAKLINNLGIKDIELQLDELTEDEKKIILRGCLINHYKAEAKAKK